MNFLTVLLIVFIISIIISFQFEPIGIIIFLVFLFYELLNPDIKIVGQDEYIIYSTTPSSQIKTNNSFILGTGYINSNEIYLGNIKIKPNIFKRIDIPVNKTLRIIDKNLTDKAIYIKYKCQVKFPIGVSDINYCDELINKLNNNENNKFYNKLYIPKNSIVKILKFQ